MLWFPFILIGHSRLIIFAHSSSTLFICFQALHLLIKGRHVHACPHSMKIQKSHSLLILFLSTVSIYETFEKTTGNISFALFDNTTAKHGNVLQNNFLYFFIFILCFLYRVVSYAIEIKSKTIQNLMNSKRVKYIIKQN